MYRDDREALRAQVDKLQDEIEEVKKHGDPAMDDRARALRDEVARMEKHLAAMHHQERMLRGDARGPGRAIAIALGATAVVGALGALVFLRTTAAPVDSAEPTEPAEPTATAAPPEPEALVPPDPPEVTAAPAPKPMEPDGAETLTWRASVVRATGVALAPGARCTVSADVIRRRSRRDFYDVGLHILCGAVKVYDTDIPLGGGMITESSQVRELPGPTNETAVYTLKRGDAGPRSGPRPELDLDTNVGKAVAWRGGIAALRVELRIDTTSAPAPPLSLDAERLERHGTLRAADRTAPVKPGEPCVARAVFTGAAFDCTVEVTCGGKRLIAPIDAASCEQKDGTLTVASAPSGAAKDFHFDRSSREARIGAKTPSPWTASLDLEPKD